MNALTVRNLDPTVKQKLRERAAARGVSMEQYVRDVLTNDTKSPPGRRIDVAAILALGVKPDKPFDLKKVSDEMWDEGLS